MKKETMNNDRIYESNRDPRPSIPVRCGNTDASIMDKSRIAWHAMNFAERGIRLDRRSLANIVRAVTGRYDRRLIRYAVTLYDRCTSAAV
jgi:hypothetical protein